MTNKDVIIARLLRQNKQQADQIRLLTEENQKFRERIAHLEKNSSNSSKPPSSDIINPKPPAKTGRKRKRGGQLGHKKHSRKPFAPEQIDKTIIHELPAAYAKTKTSSNSSPNHSKRTMQTRNRHQFCQHNCKSDEKNSQ